MAREQVAVRERRVRFEGRCLEVGRRDEFNRLLGLIRLKLEFC